MDEDTSLFSVFKNIATKNYTSQVLLQKITPEKEEEKVKPYILNENSILLGFKTVNYAKGNEVVIDLAFTSENELTGTKEANSKIIVVIGDRGSGKSIQLRIIIDNYIAKFKCSVFVIDPAGEYYTMRFPLYEPSVEINGKTYLNPYSEDDEEYRNMIDEFLAQFSLQRRGYRICIIRPRFLGEDELNVDKVFSIGYPQIKKLLKADRSILQYLTQLIGLQPSESESGQEILATATLDDSLKTWKDLERKISQIQRQDKSTIQILGRRLRARIADGTLSDDPKDHIDVLRLLTEYNCVIFSGAMPEIGEDEGRSLRTYNSIIKLLLKTIEVDMRRLSNGAADTTLKNDIILIAADEADTLAPREGTSTLKAFFERIVTKDRKYGINFVIAYQEASKASALLVKESSILISSRPSASIDAAGGIGNFEAIKKAYGFNDTVMKTFKRLGWHERTSIQTSSVEWGLCIKGMPDISTYRSIVPLHQYKAQGKGKPIQIKMMVS